ncbi:M28 family metallopeptidase [Halobaculum gomorrense]|uniref:Carboxypeptidase Q n=1 Tax=Halobaculum gomorrense TaxID=43928 RepID=A0A1M5M492_9EURY|nr:M28 family metallopeptidase [Halobaculum gomorrense]SHG72095.1 Zn-dependent amino-or carboxypeptidase, M28 family [Halobaculum gomorrense]
MRLSNAAVGDAQTSGFAWDVLTDLVDVGNRMAGQAGERRGAEVVRDAFERAGARETRLKVFEIPGWWRGSSSLTVHDPHERTHDGQQDVLALPGCPAGEATGRVVDVGDGTYEEFEEKADELDGAVAMASSATPESVDRWIHRMEKYVNAADHGAVAFVFRNHVEGSVPPTGEVGYHERPGPIPAVGVSREVGERLARYAEEDCEATVSVECRNEPTTSVNAEAEVGPDTDEHVLVTAHVDAHDIADGANDNGAGSALVAEVARLLSREDVDLDTRVRLITFGSEEIGLWGAYHCAETTDLDDLRCVVNLDGACSSRNLRVGTNGFEAMGAVFEAVTDDLDATLSTDDTISPHGDQWAFVQEGVPAVITSTTSERSGRGWGHTHADTLDKLDSRDLRDVAVQVAEAAARFASDDVDTQHKSRQELRDAIDQGYEQELRMGGRWPYDDLE